MDVIRASRQNARNKRKIAEEAAQVASAQLQGVGSETWKALWEAARTYSLTPYPQSEFPVVEDARCVLCQQTLADEAKYRLKEFEKFVQGDVEKAAASAEVAYRDALQDLPAALTDELVTQHCQAAGLGVDSDLLPDIKLFWQQLATTRDAMQIEEPDDAATAISLPPHVVAVLEAKTKSLEAQAKQHDEDAAGFDRDAAKKQLGELEAQRWTSQQAAAISAEIKHLKSLAKFDEWLKLANTLATTVKGGQVAEKAITEAYVSRFNQELKALKASRLKVELVKSQSVKGRAYHRLKLQDAIDMIAKPDEVLSEGERRIISLAAFLADVAEKPHASTFIFDDPISSLDQDYEKAVADRLVELAMTRQVLIFTHRLSLYGLLEEAVKKMGDGWKKQHYEERCIETYSNASGVPVAQPIWAAKTDKANNDLLSRLSAAKKVGDESGGDAYRALAQGICGDFRKLIERTIESDLLAEIVLRQRRGIQTEGRLSKLAIIEPGDLKYIDGLMTKFSAFVHSQSQENPVQIPEEPELRNDLEGLLDWRKGFKSRQASGVGKSG